MGAVGFVARGEPYQEAGIKHIEWYSISSMGIFYIQTRHLEYAA